MLLIPAIAKRLTCGFRIAKMQLHYPFHPEWEVPLDPVVLAILDQPFRYIDKGSQAFVFESQDGKYVIKFFRYDRPFSESKILALFNASKLAYDLLKEETGLIYIHLNETPSSLPTLHCKDAVGRGYQFRLDECRFAIQKKAKTFQVAIREARRDSALMQKRLDQFIDLLVARTGAGVFNTDPSLGRNFGFLEMRAIEIDFGNYQLLSNHSKAVEIERYGHRLRKLLSEEAPEWVSYFDQRLKERG